MNFDYYYVDTETKPFPFIKIPKALILEEEFRDICMDAKLLYAFMLDRSQLSMKNEWFDDQGRVYIVYTVKNIMKDLHCCKQKAVKLLNELENDAGLIKRKHRGIKNCSLIYVLEIH